MTQGPKIFIVRFATEFFFTRRRGGSPMGSTFPGQASGMSYACAFALAQQLRDAGFTDALVCLPTGLPAGVIDIYEATDVRSSEEFRKAWDDVIPPVTKQ